jgi:hypothetical protein
MPILTASGKLDLGNAAIYMPVKGFGAGGSPDGDVELYGILKYLLVIDW